MIVLSLSESPLEDLIHAFIYGLKPILRQLVKSQVVQKEALTIPEVMAFAVQLDEYV